MINLKSDQEISVMQEGGEILTQVMNLLVKSCEIGISTLEMDKIAEKKIASFGAYPSFKKVGNFKWSICSCVNDVVVHGIPSDYRLKSGDVVGIDCGVLYKGFNTDASWTLYLNNSNESAVIRNFLQSGRKALKKAINQFRKGNYIYDISRAIETVIEREGYSIVRSLVGHGIGRQLHEEPEVPGFVGNKNREDTAQITEGTVLAIEVIYNLGSPEITYKNSDGWTIATKDGKISGLFETTVACTSHGVSVLTKLRSDIR